MSTLPSEPASAREAATTLAAGSSTRTGGMHFYVDAWDPSYGSSVEVGEAQFAPTTAPVVDADIETPASSWAPGPATVVAPPGAVLFIDGVRRVDARVWIDTLGQGTGASLGLCASYASGVVCCCSDGGAHLLDANVRRGLFTSTVAATDLDAGVVGVYPVNLTPEDPTRNPAAVLSDAVQRRLAELEVITAANARSQLTGHGVGDGTDLVVIDGPLRGRPSLERTLGLVKSHQTAYLEPRLNQVVTALDAGERTPVFLLGTNWERYSWYLRLPSIPGPPWVGVVRVECATDMPVAGAVALANLTQAVLPRFASSEVKDPRAPQNLVPIAGLERQLRRRLGDVGLVTRALRVAAENS